jgi:hypothetical protein
MQIGFLLFLLLPLYLFVFFFWVWPAMRARQANAPKVQTYTIVLIAVLGLAVLVSLGIYLLLYDVTSANSVPAKEPAPPLEVQPAARRADAPLALATGINRGT